MSFKALTGWGELTSYDLVKRMLAERKLSETQREIRIAFVIDDF